MTFDPIAALRDFIKAQDDGSTLIYVDITVATGVDMSVQSGGRNLLRRALRLERRPFKSLRGEGLGAGIVLSSASNAADLSQDGVIRTLRKAERERRRTKALATRHMAEMSTADRERILRHGSFYGALSVAQTGALGPKKEPAPLPPAPTLPKTG